MVITPKHELKTCKGHFHPSGEIHETASPYSVLKIRKRTGYRILSLMIISLLMFCLSAAAFAANDPANAPILALDVTSDAVIENEGDYAYFSYTPSETRIYDFYSEASADTYGYLYDENMNQLFYDDDSGDNNNFKITYELNAGTKYYFGVRFYSNGSGTIPVILSLNPYCTISGYVTNALTGDSLPNVTVQYGDNSTSCNSDGSYKLVVLPGTEDLVFTKQGFGTVQYDNVTTAAGQAITYDAAMNLPSMPALALDVPGDAVIDNGGGYVYFSFTPSETMRCDFYSSANADTYGYLYNGNMEQLASNDDSGEGSNFKITYEVIAGERYCLGVRYYNSSVTGSFPVVVSPNPYSRVSGYVRDAVTGNAIGGVSVLYSGYSAETDYSGYYQFELLPCSGTLQFIMAGYESVQLQGVLFEAGKTTQQDAELTKSDPANSTALVLDAEATAEISAGGSFAYFTFTPSRSRTYHFKSLSYDDTRAYLLDADRNLLDYNWRGDGFTLSQYLEAGTQYYYGVRYSDGDRTGSFPVLLTYDKMGAIEGHVTDARTGAPLSDVYVNYGNGHATTYTDNDGYFRFDLEVATMPLSFSLYGYNELRYENVPCEEDVTTTRDASLSKFIPENAVNLVLEQLASGGSLGYNSDNYWKFTPRSTKTYHFYSMSSADTSVSVYDSYMDELTATVDSDSHLSHLACRLTAGNQYYFKVHANGSGDNWVMLSASEKGALTGRAYTASGASPITDVLVRFGNNSTLTDENGYYWMLLPAGNANLSFSKNDYVELSYDDVSIQANTTTEKDAVLSEALDDDQYRVVLTWGSSPSDLDSHLEGPGFHVWYSNMTARNAWLDVDDTSSYGPETTTFTVDADRTYTFYVHDYSNKGYSNSTALANSGAIVRIYNGRRQIAERAVPNGAGTYWNVFTLRNGVIRFIDTIGQIRPDSTTDTTLVREDQYLISVAEADGRAISGATVTYDGETKYSDEYGNALFDAFSFGNPVITVELDGYIPWTNQYSAWEKSATRFETVVLYPEGVGNLKLRSARYSNQRNMSFSVELLTTTKTVSLGSDAPLTGDLDNGVFYLSCIANDPSTVASYQLWQGRKKIADSTDGAFTLNSNSFAKGGDCYIRAIGKDRTEVDTAINLTFAKAEINDETVIDLSKNGASIQIGDDIPFLGGSSLDLDFPFKVRVTPFVSASDNKLKFGFNLKDNVDDPEKQFNDAKKLCEDVRRSCGLNVGKLSGSQAATFQSLIKDRNKTNFFSSSAMKDSFEWNLMGYAEGDLGGSTATGCLIFQVKISPIELEYNAWCVVVPVTVQVEVSVDGSFTGEVSYHFDTSTLDAALSATVSPSLKAFGGVGVSKLVGVGAYGIATLDINADILPRPAITNIDLTGELGIKAYLAFLTYEKPFAYNTWHLYTGYSTRDGDVAEGGEYDFYNQMRRGMYDASQYTRADLSYLSAERVRSGLEPDDDFVARDYGNELGTSFDSLIQNTYRNAQPVMVSTDNAIYAAFLRADASTGCVYTAVSKYDGSYWSSPVAVTMNNTLDNMPSLLIDGAGRIWLAYAQTAESFDGESLLDYALNQEIVVGQINPDTLAFTPHNVYNGMGYAHMQELSLVNGVPTLIWVSSVVETDNDVLWPTQNSVYQVSFTGSTWGEAVLVSSVDSVITELTAGQENGRLAVACVTDRDNVSDTADDRQLLILSGGRAQSVADTASGVRYGTIPGTTAEGFIWNDNGTLRSTNGDELAVDSIVGEFYIQGNSIYYVIATENGAELCVSKYENGAWSQPIVLTEGSGYLENISIAQLDGRDFVLGLYTDVTITDDGVNDSKDLVWTTVSAVSDIRVDGVDYNADGLVPGASVPLTVEIRNAGDHLVSSVDLYINGSQVSTEEVNVPVGQSTNLTMNVDCPDTLTEMSVFIQETNREDYRPDDNTWNLKIGYPDVCVSLQCEQIGSKTRVVAVLTNEGIGSASGKLFFVNLKGDVLSEKSFSSIQAGEVIVSSFDFDWNSYEGDSIDVRALFECDGEELYEYNSRDSIHLTFNGHRKTTNPDLVLPEMLVSIEEEAFMDGHFKSVKLPDSMTSIGARAFKDCERLEQIEIPASVRFIAEDAFDGVSGFVIFCPEASYAESYAAEHQITCVTE